MDGSMGVQARTDDDLRKLAHKASRAVPQLPERMEATQHLIGQLRDAMDLLANQLGPVLRAQGAMAVLEDVPEPTTELAAFIAHVQRQLRELVAFVQDLNDRVDL